MCRGHLDVSGKNVHSQILDFIRLARREGIEMTLIGLKIKAYSALKKEIKAKDKYFYIQSEHGKVLVVPKE